MLLYPLISSDRVYALGPCSGPASNGVELIRCPHEPHSQRARGQARYKASPLAGWLLSLQRGFALCTPCNLKNEELVSSWMDPPFYFYSLPTSMFCCLYLLLVIIPVWLLGFVLVLLLNSLVQCGNTCHAGRSLRIFRMLGHFTLCRTSMGLLGTVATAFGKMRMWCMQLVRCSESCCTVF